MINRALMNALEVLVDNNGLSSVLEQLAEVCNAKSEHLAVNWQDMSQSKAWGAMHSRLLRAENDAAERGL